MSTPEVWIFLWEEAESEERDWAWWREELVLSREGVGLRLNLILYLWRGGLRITDSEEVSKRLSEEVVHLEAELGGRREKMRANVVESISLRGYFSLWVSRDSRAGIVERFGGESEDPGWKCFQGSGRWREGSNWESQRGPLIELGPKIGSRHWGLLIFRRSNGSISLGSGIWGWGSGGERVGELVWYQRN